MGQVTMADTDDTWRKEHAEWKNEQIRSINSNMNRLQDRTNNASDKISDKLIVVCTGLLALIGTLLFGSSDIKLSPGEKTIITGSITLLFVSVGFGFVNYQIVYSFWRGLALRMAGEAKMITGDKSKTSQEAETLRADLVLYRSEYQRSNNAAALWAQALTFIVAVLLIVCLMIIRLYKS